jgi:hypothetical protein
MPATAKCSAFFSAARYSASAISFALFSSIWARLSGVDIQATSFALWPKRVETTGFVPVTRPTGELRPRPTEQLAGFSDLCAGDGHLGSVTSPSGLLSLICTGGLVS